MKVIVSGGGTGGHIYPAIAVANRLVERVPGVDILFVGAQGKMEMEKVPLAGFRIKGLWISGLQRRLTVKNLSFPFKLTSSLIRAYRIVRDFNPDVVAGFGGYASGPTLYAASAMGIPAVIQEQNSYPGITNKLLARRVEAICVAYPGMERFFPAGKIRLTGNPVRSDLLELAGKREEAMAYFGLDTDKKTLLLFGGSLGARTLNQLMRAGTDLLRTRNDIQVLWQMGKLYAEQYGQCETADLSTVRAMQYIDRMDLAYAAADVVVCRAGALTISELCLAARAAVLIPSPHVAEDHQTRNAMALVDKRAALLVRDAEAAMQALPVAFELLDDEEKRQALARQISRLAHPQAADAIVNELLQIAGR
ncbi:MAG: undecaprenyldiphospho-muramoylpentapeptide beta-N-acetylglucosaminyltransferase [Saprospiraceae bacterium]|nr:undecaprenyldiphospho-muramoylpentapeptide beta-N-acetylglucosaminyltransferase [Saprospiraceae bacterium]